jgi:exosortase
MNRQPKIAATTGWLGIACAGILIAAGIWAYWPTLNYLVESWNQEPDYSHGYLVLPVALLILWVRRPYFPGFEPQFAWAGLVWIVLAIALRIASVRLYANSIDAWSLLLWPIGILWLVGGRRLAWWCLPAVAFGLFMVPLPYRVERWLAVPLQSIATKSSCWGLQLLGQPAIAEGQAILVGDVHVDIAETCSGLRMLVAIVALAYACAVLFSRPWWERLLLIVCALPVALIANSLRIIATAFVYLHAPSDVALAIGHDLTGWLTIPLAACGYACILWYLSKLLQPADLPDAKFLGRATNSAASSG